MILQVCLVCFTYTHIVICNDYFHHLDSDIPPSPTKRVRIQSKRAQQVRHICVMNMLNISSLPINIVDRSFDSTNTS